ncbi:MAG: hypothetical protein ABSG04_06150 [Verrucomicrobiota bacterium]|jgi:hypothetical protein
MKPKMLLCLALVLSGLLFGCFASDGYAQGSAAGTLSATNDGESLEAVLDAILPGKKGFTGDVYSHLAGLPASQLNRIATAAARELSLHTTNGDVITDAINQLRFKPQANDTPTEAALRLLDSGNMGRVYLLQWIENLRGISDPVVIAPLIEMLDYPGGRADAGIKDEAAYVLCRLTGREYYPPLYQRYWQGEDYLRFVRWWREWWAKNKDRHPVFDSEIEEMIKARIGIIERQLAKDLTNYYELRLIDLDPKDVRLNRAGPTELFRLDTEDSAAFVQKDISLRIEAQFGTPAFPPFGQMPTARQSPKVELLHETLPGTDILITVQAASGNTNFVREVRDSLAKLKNPQP